MKVLKSCIFTWYLLEWPQGQFFLAPLPFFLTSSLSLYKNIKNNFQANKKFTKEIQLLLCQLNEVHVSRSYSWDKLSLSSSWRKWVQNFLASSQTTTIYAARENTSPFSPSGKKKELVTLSVLILGHLWSSLVTSVTFSSKLRNLERTKKISKTRKKEKIQRN